MVFFPRVHPRVQSLLRRFEDEHLAAIIAETAYAARPPRLRDFDAPHDNTKKYVRTLVLVSVAGASRNIGS